MYVYVIAVALLFSMAGWWLCRGPQSRELLRHPLVACNTWMHAILAHVYTQIRQQRHASDQCSLLVVRCCGLREPYSSIFFLLCAGRKGILLNTYTLDRISR